MPERPIQNHDLIQITTKYSCCCSLWSSMLWRAVAVIVALCFEQELQNQPNYLILVDIRDRPKQLTTYVAQDNLEVLHRNVVSWHSALVMFVGKSLASFWQKCTRFIGIVNHYSNPVGITGYAAASDCPISLSHCIRT